MSAQVKPDDRRVLSDIVVPLFMAGIRPEVMFNEASDELEKSFQCFHLGCLDI
jgi:hypothetical protein